MDEVRPEYLMSMDVVGLSSLTNLCSIMWQSGTVVPGWWYENLSLPVKVYAMALERGNRPMVEPQIQEEQCDFHPGRGKILPIVV